MIEKLNILMTDEEVREKGYGSFATPMDIQKLAKKINELIDAVNALSANKEGE